MNQEIVFPRRSFRDVHQLVFLFQSWELLLEADLPPALQPLKEIPQELGTVVARLLRSARDQLDSSQAGSEISLRFPATPELAELMTWASAQLTEVKGLVDDPALDPTWVAALGLAEEFVESALTQLAAESPA